MGMQRLVIYTHDVMNILGCSNRTARRLLSQIRETMGKEAGDYVTIKEFCEVVRISEVRVMNSINEDPLGEGK
jgi:hypothetical protein